VGTPTVQLDITNRRTKETLQVSFPCESGYGQTRSLFPDVYDIKIALLDKHNTAVSRLDSVATLLSGDDTDLDHILFQIQSFSAAWSIVRGNTPVTCQEATAKTVTLKAQLAGRPALLYSFACDRQSGRTTAIVNGEYTVRGQLLDAAQNVLSSTAPMTFDVKPTQRAALPRFIFEVK
jgi:hypothetical protein